MKRSKAFFKSVLKANRERLISTFEQAKKHTRKIVQEHQKTMQDRSPVVFFHTFRKKISIILSAAYGSFRSRIDRFSLEDVQRNTQTFFEKFSHQTKVFFAGAYSKFIVRGEYTRKTLLILFLSAMALGIVVKSFAAQHVTMGFEDYTVVSDPSRYDISLLQKKERTLAGLSLIKRGKFSIHNSYIIAQSRKNRK